MPAHELEPEEELVEAELELAVPAEALDAVAELSRLAVLDPEPVVEDTGAVCVGVKEPDAVIEAWGALPDADPLPVVVAAATAGSHQLAKLAVKYAEHLLTSTSNILHKRERARPKRTLPAGQIGCATMCASRGREHSGIASQSRFDIARHRACRSCEQRIGRARGEERTGSGRRAALGVGAGGGHGLRVVTSAAIVVYHTSVSPTQ